MQPTNTGSFASAIGGASPELQAAMQRRAGSQQVPAASQVSNTAPTNDPSTQQSAPITAQAPSMSAPSAAPAGGSPSPQIPFESPEAKMIVGSLGNRLKSLSKLQGAI